MNTYYIRVLTVDGEVLFEDWDCSDNAAWDLFDESVRQGNEGDVVQLIRQADEFVEAETLVSRS